MVCHNAWQIINSLLFMYFSLIAGSYIPQRKRIYTLINSGNSSCYADVIFHWLQSILISAFHIVRHYLPAISDE